MIVETQTEERSETAERNCQDEIFQENSKHSSGNEQPTATCDRVKLNPDWTRKYLREQQDLDSDLRVMLNLKQSYSKRPLWETESPCSKIVKVLWAQRERLEVKDQVLCRRWEEESRTQCSYQIV